MKGSVRSLLSRSTGIEYGIHLSFCLVPVPDEVAGADSLPCHRLIWSARSLDHTCARTLPSRIGAW